MRQFVNSTENVGQEIEPKWVPIGIMTEDPKPKRLVVATIGEKGQLNIMICPFDYRYQGLETTEEHEDNGPTKVTMDPGDGWIRRNVTFRRDIVTDTLEQIRTHVFDEMRKTEQGRNITKGWASEKDTRDKRARKYPRENRVKPDLDDKLLNSTRKSDETEWRIRDIVDEYHDKKKARAGKDTMDAQMRDANRLLQGGNNEAEAIDE